MGMVYCTMKTLLTGGSNRLKKKNGRTPSREERKEKKERKVEDIVFNNMSKYCCDDITKS